MSDAVEHVPSRTWLRLIEPIHWLGGSLDTEDDGSGEYLLAFASRDRIDDVVVAVDVAVAAGARQVHFGETERQAAVRLAHRAARLIILAHAAHVARHAEPGELAPRPPTLPRP